jgi:hypothetical protein
MRSISLSVITLVFRYLNGRTALWMLAGLSVWFTYAGVLGYLGVVKNPASHPPGIVFIAGPVIIFLTLFTLRPSATFQAAVVFPLRSTGNLSAYDPAGLFLQQG